MTATSNANLAEGEGARKDLLSTLQPGISLHGEGGRYKLDARLGAQLLSYARGSQTDRVAPQAHAELAATLAERLVFVEAFSDVRQAEIDPYAARLDGQGLGQDARNKNARNTATHRLSPYISHEWASGTNLLLRHDEQLTQTEGAGVSNQRLSRSQWRLARQPAPLGGAIEWTREDVNLSGLAAGEWRAESLKAVATAALGGEWVIGPLFGSERTHFLLGDRSDTLYGARLYWQPGARTQFDADLEHRYFGTGWDLRLRHRMPWLALAVQWSRQPVTAATSTGIAGAGSDLAGFLDAIFTTRVPDAAARSALVNELIASRGLRRELPGAVDVLAGYAQLRQDFNASAAWIAGRNSATLTLYQRSLRRLERAGDPLDAALAGNADNRQAGATLALNRQLTPLLTLDFSSSWSRISGLASRLGDESRERSHRLMLKQWLSPRTGVSAGLRYNRLRSNVPGLASFEAASALVGLDHHF